MLKKIKKKILPKDQISFIIGGCSLIGFEIIKVFISSKSKVVILYIDKKKAKNLIIKYRKINPEIYFEYLDCTSDSDLNKNFIL